MRTIETSAPGKLMLFGDHAVVHDYPCIVTAIDQRMTVRITQVDNQEFNVSAPDVDLAEYTKPLTELGERDIPKAVRFLETAYRIFLERYPQENGIKVQTKSEFSSSFGFGSSSAVTAAFVWALTENYEIPLSYKELFDICYKTVLEVQGVGSGFDIASAIWGGTIYYVKPASVVEALSAEHLPLIVGYTGIKADTATLVKMVNEEKRNNPRKIDSIFREIGSITILARQAIQANDWIRVGILMDQSQELLAQLSVSSVELDNLILAARKADAYGAKLSGAGGGDCMIAVASKENAAEVKAAIQAAGGEVMEVLAHASGVRIESAE